ncbi:potassium channel family protein [Mariniluteicoccus endophyticus]
MGTRVGSRLERWDRLAAAPLMAAALAFLVAYAVPIIRPDLAHPVWEWLTWGTWALFALDYLVRLALAQDRRQFVRTHPLDLVLIVLPLLRPLRMLRMVTLLVFLQRHAAVHLRGKVVIYLVGASTLLGFCASLAVLDAERGHPDATILNLGDALWWALTTMTTVGYGDLHPVTGVGRLVGATLMVGGIAILGTVTATIGSWLVDRVREENERENVRDDRLRAELVEINRRLDDLDRDRARTSRSGDASCGCRSTTGLA